MTARPMLTLPALGLVWLGGAVGTTARYLVGREVPHAVGVPVATVGVNVLGAFALGRLLPSTGQLVLGTGFLGGYTTFSTATLDTVRLLQQGRHIAAVGNGVGLLLGTVVLAAGGMWLGLRF